MANENSQASTAANNGNGSPRVISNPNDVATLALMQIDTINAKKDELTIAIKNLGDLTRQLVRVYGDHTRVIKELSERVKLLEEKEKAE